MRQNPHVRICGGPGSATTLVYPTVVTVPIQLLIAPTQDQMANLFATNADVPPEVLELVEAFSRSGVAVAFFGFMVMLGLGMVFSSLGGVNRSRHLSTRPGRRTRGGPPAIVSVACCAGREAFLRWVVPRLVVVAYPVNLEACSNV